MTIKSGFFNSVNNDRLYDAEDMNEFFDGLINEGVFSTIGDTLLVSAGGGLQIVVGSGRAWFLKSWLVNSADKFLTLDAADLTYGRIDIIALDFDKTYAVRENDIIVVKGTASGTPTPPALLDSDDHLQIPLAHVFVAANETVIETADITNKVGTLDCPFVTGVAEHVSVSELLVQWEAEFDNWNDERKNEFDTWILQVEADLDAIDTGDVLDELAEIRDAQFSRKNLLINGSFQIAQYGDGWVSNYDGDIALYTSILERWRICGYNCTNLDWTIAPTGTVPAGTAPPYGGRSIRLIVGGAEPSPSADALSIFTQDIESAVLAPLYKGTTKARDMTLSFLLRSNVSGTLIVEVMDHENGWSISIPYTSTGDGNWELIELLIPKESSQPLALDNGAGLGIGFCLGAGSNYTAGGSLQTAWGPITQNKRFYGQNNMIQNSSNYIEFADVQLELGSQATPFERVPFFEEMKRIQRYYEFHENWYFFGLCQANTGGVSEVVSYGRNYAAPKRNTPNENVGYTVAKTGGTTFNNLILFWETGDGPHDDNAFPLLYMEEPTQSLTLNRMYPCEINDLSFDSELYPNWN